MDSLLMTFLSPKSEENPKSTRRIRDVLSPIKTFSNTQKRLERANSRTACSFIKPLL